MRTELPAFPSERSGAEATNELETLKAKVKYLERWIACVKMVKGLHGHQYLIWEPVTSATGGSGGTPSNK